MVFKTKKNKNKSKENRKQSQSSEYGHKCAIFSELSLKFPSVSEKCFPDLVDLGIYVCGIGSFYPLVKVGEEFIEADLATVGFNKNTQIREYCFPIKNPVEDMAASNVKFQLLVIGLFLLRFDLLQRSIEQFFDRDHGESEWNLELIEIGFKDSVCNGINDLGLNFLVQVIAVFLRTELIAKDFLFHFVKV